MGATVVPMDVEKWTPRVATTLAASFSDTIHGLLSNIATNHLRIHNLGIYNSTCKKAIKSVGLQVLKPLDQLLGEAAWQGNVGIIQ